jgi:hypothetical protein
MSAPQIGRNDECPCGSGKKYKHCCLRSAEVTTSLWLQLRAAEGRLIPELLHLALDAWGEDGFLEAQRRFHHGFELPDDPAADREFESLFTTWFTLRFAPTPKRRAAAPLSAASRRLAAADGLSDLERRFLAEAAARPVSFHLITAADPGQSIDLEDLLTGDTCRVVERSASQTVRRGGVVFARTVTVDGVSIMVGSGAALLPPTYRINIQEMRAILAGDADRHLTTEAVLALDDELRRFYLSIADQVFNPKPPVLANTDGDPFLSVTMEFDLACNADEAFLALRSLDVDRDEEGVLIDPEYDAAGRLNGFGLEWTKRGNRLHRSWDNTILGHLDVDDYSITATVNSTRRATRLRKQIEKRLSGYVTFVRMTTEPMETLLARRRAHDDEPGPADVAPELTAEFLEQHWDAWLDSPVPALGDVTPREAAETPAGREKLAALLDDFEWRSERGQAAPVKRLRAALGLP